MHLTVAVCTRDRASLLEGCLRSMERMRVPDGLDWEVVVVDNGSRDHTRDVLASFQDRLPLTVVKEEAPGLSAARNRALDVATGDYILWTDDDVEVEEGWLVHYREAFLGFPHASVFGGPILPRFEGEPPEWLRRVLPRVAGAFALRDLGPEPLPLSAPRRLPFGANYAIRSAEHSGYQYREDLGRMPDALGLGNEETELISRLLKDGATGHWVPEARVHHWVPKKRQKVAYLRNHMTAEGEYSALHRDPDDLPSLPSIWKSAIHAEARFQVRRLLRSPERWITDLALASEAWGRLRAARRTPTGKRADQ